MMRHSVQLAYPPPRAAPGLMEPQRKKLKHFSLTPILYGQRRSNATRPKVGPAYPPPHPPPATYLPPSVKFITTSVLRAVPSVNIVLIFDPVVSTW